MSNEELVEQIRNGYHVTENMQVLYENNLPLIKRFMKPYTCLLYTSFLFGSTTRNGKSTMIERIADVLGDYSKTIRPETLAIKNNPDSRTASPDVAKLAGTSLCVCSEIPKRMQIDVGILQLSIIPI